MHLPDASWASEVAPVSPAGSCPAGLWAPRRFRRKAQWLVGLLALALLALLGGLQGWAFFHWQQAQQELRRYHGAAARQHLENCRRIWPYSRSGWVSRCASRAARLAGDYEAADQYLRQAEKLYGERSLELHQEWALLHASMGNITPQLEEYLLAQAERDAEQQPLIWEALAEGYLRAYRTREAFACLERWLKRDPNNVRAHRLRGDTWRRARHLRNAVPDYRQVVAQDPEDNEARYWLILGLLEAGQYAEAWPQVEQFLAQAPRKDLGQVLQARCLIGLGRYAAAQQLLEELLAQAPQHGLALRARGEVELRQGHWEQAEFWLQRAAQALPQDYLTQWWYYQALSQNSRPAAAAQKKVVEDLKNALERLEEITTRDMSARPHDPALFCELAALLLRLGQEDEAEIWWQRALWEAPNWRPAHQALADFYQRRGDLRRAAEHRQRAATLAAPTTPGS